MQHLAHRNIIIEEGNCSAVISPIGAELLRFSCNGNNVLYDGKNNNDGSYRKNTPFLFPICGRLVENSYRYQGKQYYLRKHGFAQNLVFTIEDQTAYSVVFSLSNNDETMKQFPFLFTVLVRYEIKKSQLTIGVEIINPDTKNTLSVSYGFHPAFVTGGSYVGKKILFDSDYTIKRLRVNERGFITETYGESLAQQKGIDLTENSFDHTTLLFTDCTIKRATLVLPNYDILLHLEQYPTLAVWSNNPSFLCIEPWNGLCDVSGPIIKWEDKPGLVKILPGKSVHSSFSLEVLEHIH